MLINLLFAGLGGFIGAGCRFLAGELLKFSHFPLTTLGVNVPWQLHYRHFILLKLSQKREGFLSRWHTWRLYHIFKL